MNWNDCCWRSQTTLRRAPRTGMQQAKSLKTGSLGSPASDIFLWTAALRDRFAENRADVAGRSVRPALDQAQDRGLVERRGVERAIAHRGELPAFRREPYEEVVRV